MTPGQMDARKRKMAKTIENPPNYLRIPFLIKRNGRILRMMDYHDTNYFRLFFLFL